VLVVKDDALNKSKWLTLPVGVVSIGDARLVITQADMNRR
jgi:hypothetical protein